MPGRGPVASTEAAAWALVRDLRDAARTLVARPIFTVASLLLLVLGLGAGTAVFAAVRQLLLQPLPFPEAHRLVLLWRVLPDGGRLPFAPDRYALLAEDSAVLSEVAAYVSGPDVSFAVGNPVDGAGSAERVAGAVVSADLFSVLGVAPLLGRAFSEEEGVGGGAPVVLLGESFWRRRFAADPEVVGRSLRLNGLRYTVIGVVPDRQAFPPHVEVWIPDPAATARALGLSLPVTHYVQVIGRLAPGVDVATARRRLRQAEGAAVLDGEEVDLVSLQRWLTADVGPLLVTLVAAVYSLLLLICSNLSHLQLVQATDRQRDLVMRLVLGAGRGWLVRRLLLEGVLLALVGGGLGIGLAVGLLRGFVALAPADLGRPLQTGVDGWLVLSALALAVAVGLLFGLLPSLHAAGGGRLQQVLGRGGTHATQAPGGRALRRSLVGVELAVSLVLVVGAALMSISFVRLLQVDLGLRAEGVVELRVRPSSRHSLTPRQQAAIYDELSSRLGALPGVEAVGGADVAPLDSGGFETVALVDGWTPRGGEELTPVLCRSVTGDYFRALQIRLLAGRVPAPDEEAGALVDEAFARRFLSRGQQIGRRVSVQGRWFVVTGVVQDVRYGDLRGAQEPQLYIPYRLAPFPWPELNLVVKTRGDAAELAERARGVVAQVPSVELVKPPRFLQSRAEALVARERFALWIFAFLALVSGLLAGVGVYAVTAYLLVCRRREIGIRIALGASRSNILRLVMREVLLVGVAGLSAGTAVAAATTRFLGHLLYAVEPLDPRLFALAILCLGIVVLAAAWMATRRLGRFEAAALLCQTE